MRLQKTFPALALVALTASVPLFLSNAPAAEAAASVDGEDSALHDAMETLKGGQRAVKKLMADPAANGRELLTTLQSMEAAVVVSLGETPHRPEGLEGKDAQLFGIGFKTELSKLHTQLLLMQTATLNGDAEGLKAGYDALVGIKKSGHTDYRVDE